MRAEIVERAKAGDKCIFTGTFIVVPDVAALGLPGVNAQMMRENQGGRGNTGAMGGNMGVSGLKSLGVKDLTYKTAFLACMATSAEARVRPSLTRTPSSSEPSTDVLLARRARRPTSARTTRASRRTAKSSSRA